MTSSPAPDLEELEQLLDGAAGADFLPVGWQAVFGYFPALITELRAAREAAPRWHHDPAAPPEHFCEDCDSLRAESGRLREALERLPRWSIRWNDNDEGTIEVVSLRRVLALLATPPAPSDHGAGEREKAEATKAKHALMGFVGGDDDDSICVACQEEWPCSEWKRVSRVLDHGSDLGPDA